MLQSPTSGLQATHTPSAIRQLLVGADAGPPHLHPVLGWAGKHTPDRWSSTRWGRQAYIGGARAQACRF